jgi:hypothetical protein
MLQQFEWIVVTGAIFAQGAYAPMVKYPSYVINA